jgi:hypothetical protein
MLKFIAKHLNPEHLKIRIHKDIEAKCAFTGEAIIEGVAIADLIKDTFTDHQYLKFKSDYASVAVALCIENVIHTGTTNKRGAENWVSLRNFSFLATESELRFLKRDEILDTLFHLRETPFYFCVTYSNKKHTAFKARINSNTRKLYIRTDIDEVYIDLDVVDKYFPIIQSWYSILEGKAGSSSEPTYFTKEEIKGNEFPIVQKVETYGYEKFRTENEKLNLHRGSAHFNFIVDFLTKQ